MERGRSNFEVCLHCGGQHDGPCGVKEATMRILEGYRPRRMTAGFGCPNGHGDGIWKWGPKSLSFECGECGALVDPRTGEPSLPPSPVTMPPPSGVPHVGPCGVIRERVSWRRRLARLIGGDR